MVDSDAIFIYQIVQRMNDKAKCLIEIIHPSNIGYLETKSYSKESRAMSSKSYRNSSLFASGVLFTTNALDTLICQAFYNPMIIRVLNKLVSGADYKEENEIGIDNIQVIKKNQKNKDNKIEIQSIVSSCIYQMPIPEIATKTYGSLFNKLSTQGIIPIALLRGVFPQTGVGPRLNTKPYVFTNPQKDTEIFSCDKVFVLSQKPIELQGINTGFIDKLREENIDKSLFAEIIRDNIKINESNQDVFIDKIKSLSSDFDKKAQDLLKIIKNISKDP